MKKHYRHANDCLNCGTILEGKFCHNCGQENLEMKESFGHMVTHAVSDYFHFDDQFFSTLKPLFLKPGKLTVDYLAGKRAHYLHPVKMYIFISLLFFVVLFKGGKHDPIKINNDAETKEQKGANEFQQTIAQDISKDKNLTPAQKRELQGKLNTYVPGLAGTALKDTTKSKKEHEGNFIVFGNDQESKTYEEYLLKQSKLPESKRDNILERYITKKSFDWQKLGKSAPEVFAESYKHNVPKVMFLLLPLFALILQIAFWKNKKYYVEHIIYSIHLHCFIFLFWIVVLVSQLVIPYKWFSDLTNTISFFVILWYIYRSLRVVYNRSRWRTVSKMLGVFIMYMLTTAFCFFIFIVITAITSV
ncbi:DUF3667 domain-containing protein [Mucilaginibacter terrenus]|uniref:DUF3667 domain-containing protein n=1 Tax=Mucilaginibacter terrenus TaxID=2482727 RepID=A0A3E2NUL5_9SPHI|nr:DUF3667 domain-containing protein [Mucilaginibacter terrenus]RFZ84659.1 DUF3667 domain-containing protein [Mucilaginibacter terrenus]